MAEAGAKVIDMWEEQNPVTIKHKFGKDISIVEAGHDFRKVRVLHKPSGKWISEPSLSDCGEVIRDRLLRHMVDKVRNMATGNHHKGDKPKKTSGGKGRLAAFDAPTPERRRHGAVFKDLAVVDGDLAQPVWRTGGRDWLKTAKSKEWLTTQQHDAALMFDEIWTGCMNAESIRSGLDPHTLLMKMIHGASTKNATGLNDGPLFFIGRMKRIHGKIGEAGVKFLVGVICDGKQPGAMVPVMTGKSTDADNKIGLGFLRHLLNEVG